MEAIYNHILPFINGGAIEGNELWQFQSTDPITETLGGANFEEDEGYDILDYL